MRSTGDGFWYFTDTLVTYTPKSAGAGGARPLSGAQLGLVIALPVVCGVLLLLVASLAAWWVCKRRRNRYRARTGGVVSVAVGNPFQYQTA